MSAGLAAYTIVHVAFSLVGLFAGVVVLAGLFASKRLDGWTATFLATTVATSVTGFGFPVDHFLPSHAVGIISLLVLTVAIVARYRRTMVGSWRWIYVAAAVVALYLNAFVGIVQAFLKIPALNALAPTQTEPAFLIAQSIALVLFAAAGIAAAVRFRPGGTLRLQRSPALS